MFHGPAVALRGVHPAQTAELHPSLKRLLLVSTKASFFQPFSLCRNWGTSGNVHEGTSNGEEAGKELKLQLFRF